MQLVCLWCGDRMKIQKKKNWGGGGGIGIFFFKLGKSLLNPIGNFVPEDTKKSLHGFTLSGPYGK